ncbi:MAG TPA: hypothetical protein VGB85_01100 [Nannocystis sp.]
MLARLVVATATLLTPVLARAAPIEFVEQRRNFMVFNDVDGTVENANWFARESFYQGYYPIEEGFLKAHPDDSQFIVVYSTFKLVQGVGAFYQSLANDVAGIGYQKAADLDPIIPEEFFDDTPDSQFQGMLHMNDWHNFMLPGNTGFNDQWISLVFGQELGHAWLAFVHADLGEGPSDKMLGRAKAHWSFYLHSDGSPVEGHRWTDNGDGSFTAAKLTEYQFSDLDLYLMGLMGPDEVEPWFLIEDPHDCPDSNLEDKACADPSGHGFKADQYRVHGTRRDITIKDVINVEGPRMPAYPDAPNAFDLSFILIKRPDEVLCDDELAAIDEIVDRSIAEWVGQTRGRATLVNRTHVDAEPEPGPACETPVDSESSSSSDTGDAASAGEDTGPTPTTGNNDTSSTAPTSEGSESSEGGQQTETSCACRNAPAGPWLLSTLLLPLLRRRRRA